MGANECAWKLAPGDYVDAVGWLEMFDERPCLQTRFSVWMVGERFRSLERKAVR